MVRINYEDLVSHPQLACDRLFSFIGVPAQSVELATSRQRTKAFSELIVNWKAVLNAVKDSEFSQELTDFDVRR